MVHFCQKLIWEMNGTSTYHTSLEFIKTTPGNIDVELLDMILPYLRWVLLAMNIVRLVLIILSFKYPAVYKYFVYF